MAEVRRMTDTTIVGAMAMLAGGAVATQGASMNIPLSEVAISTVLAMMATGLVTWGMFKKATEKNDEELRLLRQSLAHMIDTLTEVRVRVARIEGRLAPGHRVGETDHDQEF
jgi:hypothetical protein